MKADPILTERDYLSLAVALSTEANVMQNLHGYFLDGCSRLYRSLRLFKLLENSLGDVLEIGPFYGYVPFVLQPRASSYTVLEGDDPAAYPLKPLYQKRGIKLAFVDLFELFGPTHAARHRLDFPDSSFDAVLCWETMEHFNFNPVAFVREILRILKPGGKVYITVPNLAAFPSLVRFVFGRFENQLVDAYFTFENYESNGKKAFYGFHWREYSPRELAHLFTRAGFTVRDCGTFVAFHQTQKLSVARRLARGANSVASALLPRFGNHVYLVASK